jgi:hypothetical protein
METPMPACGLASAESAAPASNGDIAEGSVLLILIERGGRRVVGNINVRPAVAIQIGGRDAQAVSAYSGPHAGLLAHIDKGAVALVVIENVLAAGQVPAVRRQPECPCKCRDHPRAGRGLQIEVDIVGDEQIEMAVAIVVDKSAAGVPADLRPGLNQSAPARHVGKGAVAVVAVERVLAVVGDKQIVEPSLL